jgi:hypothetical protein
VIEGPELAVSAIHAKVRRAGYRGVLDDPDEVAS